MKTRTGIVAGILIMLLAVACNHDDEPLNVFYFSTVVVEQNDTAFSEQSAESRELYNTLYSQITEISRNYTRDTFIFTTWGDRNKTYRTNDLIEIRRFRTAIAELDTIMRERYDAEKIDVARDGSFIVRLSVFVARDKKLAGSHSINYVFNRFNQ